MGCYGAQGAFSPNSAHSSSPNHILTHGRNRSIDHSFQPLIMPHREKKKQQQQRSEAAGAAVWQEDQSAASAAAAAAAAAAVAGGGCRE
jgi:hypothetical protein